MSFAFILRCKIIKKHEKSSLIIYSIIPRPSSSLTKIAKIFLNSPFPQIFLVYPNFLSLTKVEISFFEPWVVVLVNWKFFILENSCFYDFWTSKTYVYI